MNKLLWVMLSILVALPIAANAEVYKWKDKDGVIKYSDTPPPSNIEKLPVNGKKPVATPDKAGATATENVQDPATTPAPAASPADSKKKPAASTQGDAMKRQQDAEEEKKKAEQKAAELKQKQENCANAKNNSATYKRGGRITKTNESGEREYLGDKEITENLEKAQKEVSEFCE